AMVPRPRRGVGGHRRGPHRGRAALRAGRLPGAGRRRRHRAEPAAGARGPRRGGRGAAEQPAHQARGPDRAGSPRPGRRRPRLLLPRVNSYDVAVVGGGPVGMWLAAELHRGGVRPVVLERQAARSPYSKAMTIYPRTVEQFAMRGIADRWLAEGTPVPS